jgi:hypothetical protein
LTGYFSSVPFSFFVKLQICQVYLSSSFLKSFIIETYSIEFWAKPFFVSLAFDFDLKLMKKEPAISLKTVLA